MPVITACRDKKVGIHIKGGGSDFHSHIVAHPVEWLGHNDPLKGSLDYQVSTGTRSKPTFGSFSSY